MGDSKPLGVCGSNESCQIEAVRRNIDSLRDVSSSNQLISQNDRVTEEDRARYENWVIQENMKAQAINNSAMEVKNSVKAADKLELKYDNLQKELEDQQKRMFLFNEEAERVIDATMKNHSTTNENIVTLEKEMSNLNEVLMNLPHQYSRDSLAAEVRSIKSDSLKLQDEVREVRDQLAALKHRLTEQTSVRTPDVTRITSLTENKPLPGSANQDLQKQKPELA